MNEAQLVYYVFSLHRGILAGIFAHFFVGIDIIMGDFQPYQGAMNKINFWGFRCINLYPSVLGYYNTTEPLVNYFNEQAGMDEASRLLNDGRLDDVKCTRKNADEHYKKLQVNKELMFRYGILTVSQKDIDAGKQKEEAFKKNEEVIKQYEE